MKTGLNLMTAHWFLPERRMEKYAWSAMAKMCGGCEDLTVSLYSATVCKR